MLLLAEVSSDQRLLTGVLLSIVVGVGTDDRLACRIDDLVFLQIVCNTGFHPLLAYIAFCSVKEVEWPCVDLEDPFFRSFSIAGLRGT